VAVPAGVVTAMGRSSHRGHFSQSRVLENSGNWLHTVESHSDHIHKIAPANVTEAPFVSVVGLNEKMTGPVICA
jgi:hypothetical protein